MTTEPAKPGAPRLSVRSFCASFDEAQVLRNITLDLYRNERLAIIGPSGSGKTTFLRSLNRLNDLEIGFSRTGEIVFNGQDIFERGVDVARLRRQIGMVYAVPIPLPWTIYENLAFGPRMAGIRGKDRLDERVEVSLRHAMLWDEVKDRLHESALGFSGGQHQRLCIARAIAVSPEIILMDEPCSALDPRSTTRIEDLIGELRGEYTIIIVTHNMQQAARVSDFTAFLYEGTLVEFGPTKQLFTKPEKKETEDYITGRFG